MPIRPQSSGIVAGHFRLIHFATVDPQSVAINPTAGVADTAQGFVHGFDHFGRQGEGAREHLLHALAATS